MTKLNRFGFLLSAMLLGMLAVDVGERVLSSRDGGFHRDRRGARGASVDACERCGRGA